MGRWNDGESGEKRALRCDETLDGNWEFGGMAHAECSVCSQTYNKTWRELLKISVPHIKMDNSLYSPLNKVRKWGYTGFTLSACPYVNIIVSALYLRQY